MTTPTPVPYRQTSPMAIVSLVSGLLGWTVVPLIGSIVAIVTGHLARSEIRRAPDHTDGDGLAISGLILGYTAIALGVLLLMLAFLVFGGIFAMIAAAS